MELDMSHKRAIIAATRLQFSPQVQPVRQTALDRIVQYQLFLDRGDKGLTMLQVENRISSFVGGPAIRVGDIRESVGRLVAAGRVLQHRGVGVSTRFRLEPDAAEGLQFEQQAVEKRFAKVVHELFRYGLPTPDEYAPAFIDCLTAVFSRLGEHYVRHLTGNLTKTEFLQISSLSATIQRVRGRYPALNGTTLEDGVMAFFKESTPEYDSIKWHMTQTHYLAKILGMDQSGYLLSKEVFDGASLFLDTNVLISALEPSATHHNSFKTLSMVCAQSDVTLSVARITFDQLRDVVDYHAGLIRKVARQIPPATESKIGDTFYQAYLNHLEETGSDDLSQALYNFYHPEEILESSYDVQILDDPWFITARAAPDMQSLVERIQEASLNRRRRRKRSGSAEHDALLLRWAQAEQTRTGKNCLVVTLDTTLPGLLEEDSNRPTAIGLDALLQWISPLAVRNGAEDEIAAMFASVVRDLLLPQERIFDLRDFEMFAEMEWSSKELPAEDVEGCIRYIKANAPALDPANPVDREKLSREISRFFVDPGRKYTAAIQEAEAVAARMTLEHNRQREDMARQAQLQDQRIQELEAAAAAVEEDRARKSLRSKAIWRLCLCLGGFLIYELVVGYTAVKIGDGVSWLDKLGKAWNVEFLGVLLLCGGVWLLVGKDGLKNLGWAIGKIFKVD